MRQTEEQQCLCILSSYNYRLTEISSMYLIKAINKFADDTWDTSNSDNMTLNEVEQKR